MNYAFDICKYISNLLPTFLRTPVMLAWLDCMTKPIKYIHTEFINAFNAAENEIIFLPQTQLLQYHLQAMFHPGYSDFTVTNLANGTPQLYIGQHNNPQYLIYLGLHNDPNYLIYLYPHGVATPPGFDYEITITSSLYVTLSDAQFQNIIAIANRFTPVGKTYVIMESFTIGEPSQLYPPSS